MIFIPDGGQTKAIYGKDFNLINKALFEFLYGIYGCDYFITAVMNQVSIENQIKQIRERKYIQKSNLNGVKNSISTQSTGQKAGEESSYLTQKSSMQGQSSSLGPSASQRPGNRA